MLSDLEKRRIRQGAPSPLLEGKVLDPPLDAKGWMRVEVDAEPGVAQLCPWTPRVDREPKAGDAAAVIESNSGNYWVVQWWPQGVVAAPSPEFTDGSIFLNDDKRITFRDTATGRFSIDALNGDLRLFTEDTDGSNGALRALLTRAGVLMIPGSLRVDTISPNANTNLRLVGGNATSSQGNGRVEVWDRLSVSDMHNFGAFPDPPPGGIHAQAIQAGGYDTNIDRTEPFLLTPSGGTGTRRRRRMMRMRTATADSRLFSLFYQSRDNVNWANAGGGGTLITMRADYYSLSGMSRWLLEGGYQTPFKLTLLESAGSIPPHLQMSAEATDPGGFSYVHIFSHVSAYVLLSAEVEYDLDDRTSTGVLTWEGQIAFTGTNVVDATPGKNAPKTQHIIHEGHIRGNNEAYAPNFTGGTGVPVSRLGTSGLWYLEQAFAPTVDCWFEAESQLSIVSAQNVLDANYTYIFHRLLRNGVNYDIQYGGLIQKYGDNFRPARASSKWPLPGDGATYTIRTEFGGGNTDTTNEWTYHQSASHMMMTSRAVTR